MKIAVLALQGAFIEHQQILAKLGVESCQIRNLNDWNNYLAEAEVHRGLIIPGGESTAMLRIMKDEGLTEPLRQSILNGLPVLGTCAGMIVLAKSVENDSRSRLETMDIEVRRNAYGRQLGSFNANADCKHIGVIPMTFIRAPYINSVSGNVEILASLDGHIVAAQQGNQLVCSFHPELDSDLSFHRYFIEKVRAQAATGRETY